MPSELAIGPCVEVWAGDKPESWFEHPNWQPFSARGNHAHAFRAWVDSLNLPAEQTRPRKPTGAPWSAAFLIEHDNAALAEKLLGAGGATLRDLDALRAAAQRRVAMIRKPAP
ncbi:MAG: hypothetical protein ACR2FE_00480 [Aeromicrobium sp.]